MGEVWILKFFWKHTLTLSIPESHLILANVVAIYEPVNKFIFLTVFDHLNKSLSLVLSYSTVYHAIKDDRLLMFLSLRITTYTERPVLSCGAVY